ncbi:unnamed protein product [Effrenium voratum]|nr:unnamed protein product [Effrenium voratum]
MGLIIVSNLVLIMYEANQDARCYPEYFGRFHQCPHRSDAEPLLVAFNIILLAIYSIECLLRAYVERGTYICNKWNIIDLFTVVSGWLGLLVADFISVTLLRMFRLVRVVRAVRVLISVPEFYLLITGLYSSIKAIIFGALMLISMLIFWAVISVELLHPIASRLSFGQCARCPQSFDSIFSASVTLFQQIVAGDNWGQVIVERAAEARENDHEAKIKKKQAERARSMEDLASLCASMDVNNNGLISLEEMLKGYDEVEEFKKLMEAMDLKRDDMAMGFNVLDSESTQEVPYLEFCQHLGSFFKRDPVIMHSLVKYSVMELRKVVEQDVVRLLQEQSEMLKSLLEGKSCVEMKFSNLSDLSPHPKESRADELGPLLAKAQDLAETVCASVALGSAEALRVAVADLRERLEPQMLQVSVVSVDLPQAAQAAQTPQAWWCDTSARTGCRGEPRQFRRDMGQLDPFDRFQESLSRIRVSYEDEPLLVDWDKDGDLDVIVRTKQKLILFESRNPGVADQPLWIGMEMDIGMSCSGRTWAFDTISASHLRRALRSSWVRRTPLEWLLEGISAETSLWLIGMGMET